MAEADDGRCRQWDRAVSELFETVSDLLYREAAFIDEQRWLEWLDLFTEDVQYWIPCWDDDGRPTSDPQSEVSLIYYDSRKGLEDRVARIRSGLSAASVSMPRTCHQVTNVRVKKADGDLLEVASTWAAYSFHGGETKIFYGFYDYQLRRVDSAWRISAKKITILNDVIPTLLDIFSV
jgi:3-phenylpropionate/cinnamic acid dioxygenase small subunit